MVEEGRAGEDGGGIQELAAQFMASYARHAGGGGLLPQFLPNRDAVIEAVETLRQVLFPGYFERGGLDEENLEVKIAHLLVTVQESLQTEICRALNYGDPDAARQCMGKSARAQEICRAFLERLPAIREVLLTDIEATVDGDPASHDAHEVIFAYPGIYAITVYRLAHELYGLGVPLIPRMMTEYAHGLTGIDINPGATIGHHFFIDHGTGIVVGETTQIGNHVKIYQGVTLGALSTRGGRKLSGKKRHPTLGDEVTVYSSSSILGGESVIGDGAVIGSNTFITHSVAPGTRVSMKAPELDIKKFGGGGKGQS
jgi:serine O-acetyltransferase